MAGEKKAKTIKIINCSFKLFGLKYYFKTLLFASTTSYFYVIFDKNFSCRFKCSVSNQNIEQDANLN